MISQSHTHTHIHTHTLYYCKESCVASCSFIILASQLTDDLPRAVVISDKLVMTGFARRGLQHTSNLPTLTIHS